VLVDPRSRSRDQHGEEYGYDPGLPVRTP
jgi:hypothetical protein